MKTLFTILPALVLLASCTTPPAPVATIDYDKALANMIATSFESRGIATVERLKQQRRRTRCQTV
jgi:hypothetical protein